MLNAESGANDSRKFFIGDMQAEMTGLKARFDLDDAQLKQIETLLQWSYNSGFHSGTSYGRQLSFNDRVATDPVSW